MGPFDLHIVGNAIPEDLMGELAKIGYTPRQVVGGDKRVRMESLLTNKCSDKHTADSLFDASVDLILKHPAFFGYIEEEATTQDLAIKAAPAKDQRELPLTLRPAKPQDGIYKRCDIHATDAGGDLGLRDRLLAAGFYFIELEKPGVGRSTVFTMQFENVADGEQVWQALKDYLLRGVGFVGSMKFEATLRMRNFGFDLPPIVLSEHLIHEGSISISRE